MLKSLRQVWVDSKSPLDYVMAVWISGLFLTAVAGMTGLFYGIITGQVDFSNATFGIFDTLG